MKRDAKTADELLLEAARLKLHAARLEAELAERRLRDYRRSQEAADGATAAPRIQTRIYGGKQ